MLASSGALLSGSQPFPSRLKLSELQSIMFLFVVHPYDVGDALFINTEWSMVEEIALQYTLVQRYDGVRIWWPNHVLAAGAVMNISRSAFRWESYKASGARMQGGECIAAVSHTCAEVCSCTMISLVAA